jgi:hypothetical protein
MSSAMGEENVRGGGMQQGKMRLYKNVAIFAVVSLIITIILLLVTSLVPGASSFGVMSMGIVLGLLIIIIVAVVKIRRTESRIMNLIHNAGQKEISVNTCPDFYTAEKKSDGSITCVNEYRPPRRKVVFKYVAQNADQPVKEEIELRDMRNTKMTHVCKVIDPADSTEPTHNVPWTAMRSKCRSLSL